MKLRPCLRIELGAAMLVLLLGGAGIMRLDRQIDRLESRNHQRGEQLRAVADFDPVRGEPARALPELQPGYRIAVRPSAGQWLLTVEKRRTEVSR